MQLIFATAGNGLLKLIRSIRLGVFIIRWVTKVIRLGFFMTGVGYSHRHDEVKVDNYIGPEIVAKAHEAT